MGVKINELSNFENRNYDDNEENQLFPVTYEQKPEKTRIRWLILCLCFFGRCYLIYFLKICKLEILIFLIFINSYLRYYVCLY